MNKTLSNLIEDIAIALFKIKNRKKTEPETFRDCCTVDHHEIRSVYHNRPLFESCKKYNPPVFIGLSGHGKSRARLYKMESMFTPVQLFQKTYESFAENRQIYFEEIGRPPSDSENKTCIIYLHGFSESSYAPEKMLFFKELIAKLPGMEILAVQLPYHMMRSPQKQPYSGAYILDSYPIVTIEGFRQAVHDASQVLSYAKDNYKNVIVAGFSLGGLVASFLGTCDDRADLYFLGQAGVHIPKTLKNLSICPGLSAKKEKLLKQGIVFESLFEPLELQSYQSVLPPKKVVSIAGLYDKLIAFEDAEELRRFFSSAYNINYPSGHRGILFEMKKIKSQVMRIIDAMAAKGGPGL